MRSFYNNYESFQENFVMFNFNPSVLEKVYILAVIS